MKRKLLIDGYNLLYQFPELRKRIERDLESGREALLNRLVSYAAEKGVEIIVVFDGDDRNVGPLESFPSVRILFSKLPEKADPLIKRLIDQNEKGTDLIVVSSDNEIAGYSRMSGIRVVSSQSFAHEMQSHPLYTTEKKFSQSLTEEELEEWLQLFGEERDGSDT